MSEGSFSELCLNIISPTIFLVRDRKSVRNNYGNKVDVSVYVLGGWFSFFLLLSFFF